VSDDVDDKDVDMRPRSRGRTGRQEEKREGGREGRGPTLLHHHGVELQLLLCSLHDLLLDGALCDEAVNIHGSLLADAMGAVLGLQVGLKKRREGGREGGWW